MSEVCLASKRKGGVSWDETAKESEDWRTLSFAYHCFKGVEG